MKGNMHHLRERHRNPPTVSTRTVRVMDRVIYVVAVIAPLFTLDQLVRIWAHHDAQGVSVVTWGAFAIFSCIWLLYGYVHKDKAIIISNILWVVLEIFVAVGALVYR